MERLRRRGAARAAARAAAAPTTGRYLEMQGFSSMRGYPPPVKTT